MLILRRHWVTYKHFLNVNVNSLTFTSEGQQLAIVVNSSHAGTISSDGNSNVGSFTHDNNFAKGEHTIYVTLTQASANTGNLGTIYFTNSKGDQEAVVLSVNITPCELSASIDSISFNPNNTTVTFNVVSTYAGTIAINNLNSNVSLSRVTFGVGTTQVTATLGANASAGSLGYITLSNSCGATNNINVSYAENQLSISPTTINLDANGTAQSATISSSILSGTITADSGIIISANSFNSGSTTIQVSAAPNSDTNSKNLGVITATDSQGNIVTCTVTQAAASVTPAQYPEGEELIGAGFYGGNVLSTNVIGSISYDDNNKENIANLRLDYQVGFTYLGDERPVRKLRLNASAKPNTLTLSLYITDSNTATTGYDGSNSDITALGTKLAEVPLTFVSGEYYSTPVDNLLTSITGTTNANTQQVTMDQQGDISNGTWTTLFSFTMPTNVLNALTSGNNIVGVVDNHRTVPGMITYNNPNSIGGAVGGIFSYDTLE